MKRNLNLAYTGADYTVDPIRDDIAVQHIADHLGYKAAI